MKFVGSWAFLVSVTSSRKNVCQDSSGSGFESELRQQYSDFRTHWGDANLVNWADCRESAVQFMIRQMKKGRSDMAPEAKKAAEVANWPVAPPAPVTATASPTTATAPATTTAATTTMAPAQSSTPATTMTPLATTGYLATSSPMSTRSTLITKKRPGVFDHKENPERRARLLTNWARQVDLPALQFMSFTVLFRGPHSTRVHSTSYASISEFHPLTNITLQNEEYQDHFGVEQGDSMEWVISDQGS
ncbi:hypothetical protein HOY80DRAFT_1041783 [Tuber brumale]|nr:hypothetical protein HOY80DRAFT_1041783 [Tuber brumale]